MFATVAVTTLTSACSGDNPLAPDLQARNGLTSTVATLVNSLLPVKAVMRDSALASEITRSFKFTKAGGQIAIPELGLRVEVPYGAIPRDTMTITVTALRGKSVAYDFQPHGTRFLKPLVFRQSLLGTSAVKAGFSGSIGGGYFKDDSQLDLLNCTALLDELLSATVRSNEATFNVYHFSGYMVSSGRQSSFSDEAF
jgi:hypothetical protein